MATTEPKCFVLMPFDSQYHEVYEDIYRPVCKANGVTCWRVDEISRPGSITRDIVEGIFDADIVIADLTAKNPNVFYELGIAHCAGNKTIMTAQSMADVPFDIANYRVIIYDQTISGSKQLAKALDQTIKELLTARERTNNPIQEVVSSRTILGHKSREPLIKYVDISRLPKSMREWIAAKQIVYAEDINRINLDELFTTPGIGQESLSRFFSPIVQHNLFADGRALQDFLLKKKVSIRTYYFTDR